MKDLIEEFKHDPETLQKLQDDFDNFRFDLFKYGLKTGNFEEPIQRALSEKITENVKVLKNLIKKYYRGRVKQFKDFNKIDKTGLGPRTFDHYYKTYNTLSLIQNMSLEEAYFLLKKDFKEINYIYYIKYQKIIF